MKKPFVTVLCAMLAWSGVVAPALSGKAFAFFDRDAPDRIMRQAKLMRRQGKYPVSLDCGAGSVKGPFNPDVDIEWRDNADNIKWEMYVYKGQLETAPSAGTDWRQVVHIVLPTGDDRFYCLLFYGR